jgi:hypothetical protein
LILLWKRLVGGGSGGGEIMGFTVIAADLQHVWQGLNFLKNDVHSFFQGEHPAILVQNINTYQSACSAYWHNDILGSHHRQNHAWSTSQS